MKQISKPLATCIVLARSISLLGSMASVLALLVWVRELTGNNGAAVLSMLAFALPTVTYPKIGQLVDRFNRLAMLMASQVFGAGLISLALLVQTRGEVWIIYLIQFTQGVNSGLISIAGDALLPQIAARSQLSGINGFFESSAQLARMIAPLIGVAIFTAFGGITWVVLFDLASFAAGLGLLAPLTTLAIGRPAESRRKAGFLENLRSGVSAVSQFPQLRLLVVVFASCVLTASLLSSAIWAVITVGLGKPTSFAGVFMSGQAIGGIAGGIAGGWIARRGTRLRAVAVTTVGLMGAGSASFLSHSVILAVAGMVAIGLGTSALLVVYTTGLQTSIDEATLGRVFATVGAVMNLTQIVGIGAAAVWLLYSPAHFQPVIAVAVSLLLITLVVVARSSALAAPARPFADQAHDQMSLRPSPTEGSAV